MNLIKLKQLDQTELATFIGTVNDPLYINNPSGYLTFASGVVMTTGNQIISGNKTFAGLITGTSGSISMASGLISDSFNAPSVDWSNKKLYTSNGVNSTAGNPSVDWSNRTLKDFDNLTSVDWNSREFFDDQNDLSLEWQNRELLDENEATSVKWHFRELKDTNDNTTVDWGNSQLLKNSEVLLNWSKSGVLSGNGGWSISGGDFLINYEKHWDNIVNTAAVSKRAADAKFIPLTGNATTGYPNLITGMTASIGMRGTNTVFFGSIYPHGITVMSIADDNNSTYTSGLDTQNRRLYDAGVFNRGLGGRPGGVHFQLYDKKLIDTIGLTSVDWDKRRLFATDGVAYTGVDSQEWSLDYQEREVNGLWNYNATFIGPISGMSAQGMTSPYINGGLSDTVVIFLTGNSDGTPAYNKSSILLYDGEKLDIITYSTGNNFMQWPTGSATSKIAVSWPDGVIHSGTSGNANTGYYNSYTIRSITGVYGINGVGSASQYGWSRFFVKHHGTYT